MDTERKTTLTYNYNGGMVNGEKKADDVVKIENPNENYTINNDCVYYHKECLG